VEELFCLVLSFFSPGRHGKEAIRSCRHDSTANLKGSAPGLEEYVALGRSEDLGNGHIKMGLDRAGRVHLLE
jgi:hypothetical protein